MEDPKVPFADTTARRAQLMAATERFKTSITDGVESIKDDATEVGKTTVFVAGAALAVYLVVNAILPKSDEYRYAEKYGEPDELDDDDYEDGDEDDLESVPPSNRKAVKQQADKIKTSAATSGLISGILTSVLTNIAREQLTGFLARIRSNNAINPTADPTEYHKQAPTEPVDYSSSL
ncbi:hypothetical protein [Spirosoma sp. KNUC1025]|uniref:hypothetical protein n=1 Tax=Spirosoma sp. KNUC1025 TaxID=2894082 RepID=UPI00386CB169|nr:hypothetical protein LN737_04145 [Spirosoma sp. KNUC1025]